MRVLSEKWHDIHAVKMMWGVWPPLCWWHVHLNADQTEAMQWVLIEVFKFLVHTAVVILSALSVQILMTDISLHSPVECVSKMFWYNIKVVVCAVWSCTGIATTTMLRQELVVIILWGILLYPQEQHVFTKMGQTRQVGRLAHKTYTQYSVISKIYYKWSTKVSHKTDFYLGSGFMWWSRKE